VAYLDFTRALKIYKTQALLASAMIQAIAYSSRLAVRMGIGNSRFVAHVAASLVPHDVFVVPPGEEKAFVAPLSADTLPVDDKIKERLHLLGLHTLKKIAALSGQALIAQFGITGKLMWKLANGMEDTNRILSTPVVAYPEREVVSEHPLETIEQLGTLLSKTIEEITLDMRKTGRVSRKIKLTLYFQNGDYLDKIFILQTPTACADKIFRRISSWLASVVRQAWGMEQRAWSRKEENATITGSGSYSSYGEREGEAQRALLTEGATQAPGIESPITGFRLSVLSLSPHEGIQDNLLKAHLHRIAKLKGAKDYLKAKYGSVPIVRVSEADMQARLPERRFVFVEV
jgi:hypothetical protein